MPHYGNPDRKIATSDELKFVQLDSVVYLEADSSYCNFTLMTKAGGGLQAA